MSNIKEGEEKMSRSDESDADEKLLQMSSDVTPWRSIYACGIGAFIQSAQFTIYFSSMWPYLKKLDPTTTESTFGYIVTSYSIAQCIASPIVGYWSNQIEQVALPLFAGFICMLLGNISYLSLQFAPISAIPAIMMMSRFITGVGSGNAGLLRAYVAMASSVTDRSRAIATVSGGIALGTMTGPAFQLLFTPLGEEGIWLGPFQLNIYNSPALFSCLLNTGGLILIKFFFEERILEFETETKEKDGVSSISPDMIAIAICISTRFSQIFMQTTIETIGSPYSMMMFGFDKEEAVTYNAAAHAVAGVIGAVLYFFFIFKDVGKYVRERSTTIICLAAFLIFFVVSYPWQFLPETVPLRINGSDEGCDAERFSWCGSLTVVYPWVYYIGYILTFGIVNSFINISVTTLYSKIIGPRRQGTLQGVYQMSGSVGRMVAPLLMSRLYTLWGPRSVWSVEGAELSIAILLWVVLLPRMVPFGHKTQQISP